MNNINNNNKHVAQRTTLRTKRSVTLQWLQCNDPLEAKIMDFLRVHFHPNEPLNRSIDLMQHPQDVATLDVLYAGCFPYGASVVAMDAQGQLVGVLLNDIVKRGVEEEDFDDERWNPTPRYAKFLDLIPAIKQEVKLFEKYPEVDTVLDHAILSVSNQWQGDGISQLLVQFSNDVIAKEFHCGLSMVMCSSFYSAKVFEKCGYKEIWSKKFRDYTEHDQILFPTEAPHENITFNILELK